MTVQPMLSKRAVLRFPVALCFLLKQFWRIQGNIGALRWVFELNFNKKIIASIFAIILTNVSAKTYTIISVKLHRH